MTNDLFMVLGIIIAAFSLPSFVGAFSEGRPPRAALLLVIIGGGLIATALVQQPGGYALGEIPDVFVRVIGTYLR